MDEVGQNIMSVTTCYTWFEKVFVYEIEIALAINQTSFLFIACNSFVCNNADAQETNSN